MRIRERNKRRVRGGGTLEAGETFVLLEGVDGAVVF